MAHAPSTPRISLVLSIPVVAYSGLGMQVLGGRTLPAPFGIPADWIMLAFAKPVALWTSTVPYWAVQALKSRVMNMSVLVSLGILTLVFVQRRLDSIRTWPGALL